MAIPTKTLAVRLFEYGGPEKLVLNEYDLPALGDRDVLVKNLAGSVSRWDVKYRAGDLARYQIPGRAAFPLPQQLGREAAGEVVATGSAVTQFKPGDRVIGVTHPEDPDSPEFARGLGNLSRNLAIPGHQAMGSYAQYLVRDEGDVAAAAGRRRLRAGRRGALAVLVIASGGGRPAARCGRATMCWSPARRAAWARRRCNLRSSPARA